MNDPNETLDGILREMRDSQSVCERCRSGGADCDVVDGYYVARHYADRVEKAVARERAKWERERRAYEKLHDCFWEKNAIQGIVRQMLDSRDDLRRVDPREADDLEYYAHELMGAAQSVSGNAAVMREALEKVSVRNAFRRLFTKEEKGGKDE